ncbi:SigB/SigF/SigG family RNA polymerase sigma factor [Marinitenerispora sediminis]|uniref:SigB/SigF/SigG family RNA polymerase sigma factor n=1 Tax=Marinitenerispora sediminis TaxID=1931232 RepID=UPI000DF3E8A5|nr:SigB/SigF/SigG family RNA polymerase sigma factor [Marinitenerispora sediminis]RCV50787.1 B/F/G family RNA polymerase sigma-70 factor [Marinitenerispora sediminis]
MPVTDIRTSASVPTTRSARRRTEKRPTSRAHAERDAEVAELFARLRRVPEEQPEHLEQAALLGLVKAINGFDPDLGHDFIAYAMPMMTGEVKRHFRDRTWAVRVPRRHQERRTELNQTIRRLTQDLGRSPTSRELAVEMRMSVDDLSELMEASAAYSALSLDSPAGEDENDSGNLGDTLGSVDTALESVVDRESLPPLLNSLPERERRIILLRFFGNKTQSQIAEEIGVSQMHVSRLLSSALARLREGMLGEE